MYRGMCTAWIDSIGPVFENSVDKYVRSSRAEKCLQLLYFATTSTPRFWSNTDTVTSVPFNIDKLISDQRPSS